MAAGYLWIKASHIVFVASGFAALFRLSRILANLAMVDRDGVGERERLQLRARDLYRFGIGLMFVALVPGPALRRSCGAGRGPRQDWMHARPALVVKPF